MAATIRGTQREVVLRSNRLTVRERSMVFRRCLAFTFGCQKTEDPATLLDEPTREIAVAGAVSTASGLATWIR